MSLSSRSENSDWVLQCWSIGKYFCRNINFYNQYLCLKSRPNTAQFFVLDRAELYLIFSSLLGDAPDIHRFPTVHMIKTCFLLELMFIIPFIIPMLNSWQMQPCKFLFQGWPQIMRNHFGLSIG